MESNYKHGVSCQEITTGAHRSPSVLDSECHDIVIRHVMITKLSISDALLNVMDQINVKDLHILVLGVLVLSIYPN